MSEEKTLQQRLDEELEKLAIEFLGQIHGYDIRHSAVRVSKDGTDGVSVKINFGTLVREQYTWNRAELTPLEKQIRELAKATGFDFGLLNSSGSGDGYTDWSSLVLGTSTH